MTDYQRPSIQTHVPETAELPAEDMSQMSGRADLPTPSLWQKSVKASHRVTREPVIVGRVDYGTMMFRAYYPKRPNRDGGFGLWGERTEWEHCRDWDVDVTYSPAELERQAARAALEAAIAKLDPESLAAAMVFCDDPDPNKNLAKLTALQKLGVIKSPADVAVAAVAEVKADKRGNNRAQQIANAQQGASNNAAAQARARAADED